MFSWCKKKSNKNQPQSYEQVCSTITKQSDSKEVGFSSSYIDQRKKYLEEIIDNEANNLYNQYEHKILEAFNSFIDLHYIYKYTQGSYSLITIEYNHIIKDNKYDIQVGIIKKEVIKRLCKMIKEKFDNLVYPDEINISYKLYSTNYFYLEIKP